MKDGLYEFHFIALDADHTGAVEVRKNMVDGGDPVHIVHGQLSRAGANMLASFEIRRRTPTSERDATSYTIKMFGSGTESDFTLIGLAPLGLIVELKGTWRSTLPEGDLDRPVDASSGT